MDTAALGKTHQTGFFIYPKVPTFSSEKKKGHKRGVIPTLSQRIVISQTYIPKPFLKTIHLVLAATSHSHVTIPHGASPASFP